ncbi:MAG TPA: DUF87 domain-containing protein [Anaerolineaceae bacterium]|nr:DUF87 domain-containing protein [Anaerolineaceae bacterium]
MAASNPSAGFYLGRPSNVQGSSSDLLYDPADLTTHGMVTGMTGSGKTGLCIALLEEAALQGIPAILIDPKGDLTNLLLHFPDQAPRDFRPWIDPEAARRQGKTLDDLAAETAEAWRNGLADWNIPLERISALQRSAHFAVYTPGSDAGYPVSILASLQAPQIAWEGNREILREKIASTVTALLGLVGLTDVDPVRSREHILLSNIFENAWSQGKNLDLSELILRTQSPPFARLGVFPVETFFPEKDRMALAMLLNNFLAAPAFQTWMEGQPLDIQKLLFPGDGRPQHSVFYLAHLGEDERMFFTTLLLSAVETWIRTQAGSSGLRALVYFDEIAGYLPPVSTPPSKAILLRMLKQARAFGVGLLLAAQNPVDLDYKALSNAGTWVIGKLQTEQDKQRLLDGLESASGSLDRGEYDRMISSLGKRTFLLHNVHAGQPVAFQSRWTMNYLAGPLTRAQIPDLNRLAAGAEAPVSETAGSRAVTPAAPPAAPAPPAPSTMGAEDLLEGSQTRPAVPAAVREYFFPNNLTLNGALQSVDLVLPPDARPLGLLYRAELLAQAQVRFLARKYNVDTLQRRAVLIPHPDRRGMVRWEDYPYPGFDPQILDPQPAPGARFAGLDAPLGDPRVLAIMEKDFADWVYRGSQVRLRANETLKVYAPPDVSTAAFREMTSQAARQGYDAEVARVAADFDQKLAAIYEKMGREQRELQQDQEELSQRKMEELGTHAENILGLFTHSRRRVSTSLTKHRMTEAAKADVEESHQTLASLKAQADELLKARAAAVQECSERWSRIAIEESEIPVTPQKKDVFLELFGLVWIPYHVLQAGEKVVELPAFKIE